MRLIDADALKESLKELKAEGNNRRYVQGLQDAIDGFFPQIIDDEPTIDAEPVKHGYWIVADDGVTRCSICYGASDYERSFCGDCGAKMDGGMNNDSNN